MKPSRFFAQTPVTPWLALLFFGWALAAHGALYTFGETSPQTIPDNDPSGIAYDFSIADPGLSVVDVSVSFNISGGWNGDLYACLSHGADTLVLLDRVGVSASSTYGYGDAGFILTLSDSASINIHAYGGNGGSQLVGTYLADGQTTSPLASAASFSASGGSATFASTFGTTDPSGSWTLFLTDVSGGSTATLESWSVGITAVPEPVNGALLVAGCLFSVVGLIRVVRARKVK